MNILELARSIGWPVDFIAFERGIVLRPQGNNWVVHSRSRAAPVEVSPLDVGEVCLPVLVRCRGPDTSVTVLDVMVRPEGGFVPLVPVFGITPSLLYDATAVQYFSGALSYHIAAIVGTYERVCDSFKEFELIPGRNVEKQAIFGNQPEPYYEFDALLGVIRRSYDACRYLLWKCFGPPKGGIPRSFEKVLPFCDRLDQKTRKELDESWRIWGVTVTEYRDCVHHYVPLDFGMASIAMEELFPGVWAALARIPDNPEARSKSQFTFKKGVDALSFGWRAASEAMRVLRIVANAVQRVTP